MGTERPRKKQPRVFSIFYELQHMSVHVVCVCVCVYLMSQRKSSAQKASAPRRGGENRGLGAGADFWRLTRLLTFRGGPSHRNYKQDAAEKRPREGAGRESRAAPSNTGSPSLQSSIVL